jgi:hypothetical protein
LLRHLNEVYKVLIQTVPDAAKTEGVADAEAFLETIVRHTDSSLAAEWEALAGRKAAPTTAAAATPTPPPPPAVAFTRDRPALVRHLRGHLLTLVTALARGQVETALGLIEPADSAGLPWTPGRLQTKLDACLAACGRIRLDPEARNARHTRIGDLPGPNDFRGVIDVTQTLVDPDESNDWALHLSLDLAQSDRARLPVLRLEDLRPC